MPMYSKSAWLNFKPYFTKKKSYILNFMFIFSIYFKVPTDFKLYIFTVV